MEKRPAFFLSHSSADEQSVTSIARQLEKQGIPTWLSAWKLSPGDVWQDKLSQALRESSGCIVFLGPGGAAPWHTEEVRFALDRAVKDASYRLVPVLLPGARRERLSDLPGFLISRQWVEFRASLDEPDTLYRLACGCRGVAPVDDPALHPDVGLTTADNPYRGLRLFDVEHDKLFFGRGLLTQELVRKLGSGNRFVSIAGASGSGKSSLARAGLLASLRDGALPGSKDWPQLIIRPGVDPLESLATGVVS
ncbi:MAG TPA: TIR domain-containing protein, partial [Myxococcales bacterium]|nr:TIR domain-containing protein [Myxococcales bacterium]